MTRRLLAAAVGLVALAVCASQAQAALSLTATGSLATGAIAPPVSWQVGAGGSNARHFLALAASANATSVSGTLLAKAGTDVTIKDALRLVNARAASQAVTLSATQAAGAEVFTWRVYNGSTLVGTLDLAAASPSLALTLPASATYTLDARVDLADGAGANNAPASFALSVAVGSALQVRNPTSTLAMSVGTATAPFGALLAGTTLGANLTNASASLPARTIVSGTDNVLYLNNTATSVSYVKLVHVSSSGLANLATLNLGVNNNSGSADHVKIGSGSVTQAAGAYQRLDASSANRIYATTLAGVLFTTGSVTFDVYVSDTASGDSFALTKARLTIT